MIALEKMGDVGSQEKRGKDNACRAGAARKSQLKQISMLMMMRMLMMMMVVTNTCRARVAQQLALPPSLASCLPPCCPLKINMF